MTARKMNGQVLEIYEDGSLLLSLAEETRDGALYIELSGQLKNQAAQELEDELMAALPVCGKLVLSFEKVTYIAGMALRSLLYVQQMADEMGKTGLVISGASPQVMEAFREVGFPDILRIETA